ALSSMSPARGLAALVVGGALSRLATLSVIAFVPYVRSTGLGVAAWDARHRGLDLVLGSATALVAAAIDWRRALIALPLVGRTAWPGSAQHAPVAFALAERPEQTIQVRMVAVDHRRDVARARVVLGVVGGCHDRQRLRVP